MPRTRIIYNPKANRGHNVHIIDALRQHAAQLGATEWVSTEHPGHATQLAIQAAEQQFDHVAAVGGDGTLHEVLNGLMLAPAITRPQLGIIPIGSGNDFVKGAHFTTDPMQAIEHLFGNEHAQKIDVGWASMAGGPQLFWINALGIGFDAAVTLQSQRITRVSGQIMYFIAAVRTIIENYDAPHMDITMDGVKASQNVQMLTLGNGTREGGGFITTPASKVNDGRLDYALFQPVSRPMMVRLLPEVMRGTHGRFDTVQIGTFKSLQIHADRPLLVHSDGEMIAVASDLVCDIDIGIIPSGVTVIT